jgi:hypothetical protein
MKRVAHPSNESMYPLAMPKRSFFMMMLVVGPLSTWAIACKKEEPPPTPTAEEPEEEKPKKKKKKVDEEEALPDVGGVADPTAGTSTVPGWKPGTPAAKTDGGSAQSNADKQKLIACCTALKNAATAAGIANSAASAAPIPGMPPPPPSPPKEELDKAAKECDKAVVNWNGDLNQSLKTVKGATAVALPSACAITL